MTYTNRPEKAYLLSGTLLKPMAICAGIALAITTLFLITVAKGKPEFSPFWQIRPLMVTFFAGAAGGAFYHLMDRQKFTGIKKLLSVLVSLLVIIIGLWLGFVLGFAGTYWH